MTQQPGKIDINQTIEAWAEICLKIWREKIITSHPPIYDTGELYNSLEKEFYRQAGEDIQKIEFAYKLYGKFVDMGVGKEFSRGNEGSVESTRKHRPWFSSRFYREVMKLRELLLNLYGRSIAYNIANTMSEVWDQRTKNPLFGRSVSNLRTIEYRQQQSKRNARNYDERRLYEGRWRGKNWIPYKK